MEDAATAEISRAQVWQWIRHPRGVLQDGRDITLDLVQTFVAEELSRIRAAMAPEDRLAEAAALFVTLVATDPFEEFLTLRAYNALT